MNNAANADLIKPGQANPNESGKQKSQEAQTTQDMQPETGMPDLEQEQQSRSQSASGAARAEQNSGDDVTESPEEA